VDELTDALYAMQSLAALCIAKLVDAGHVKYTSLVTDYWLEFGAHGKANVTVEMLVSHQAGLAAIDKPITIGLCTLFALRCTGNLDDIRSPARLSKLFEEQKPNWPPGRAFGYHALTYGWLLDQLVRRTDPKHRSLSQYYAEELLAPTGEHT
jgi:CubicO group peptidase (beta-lactamase class C family)